VLRSGSGEPSPPFAREKASAQPRAPTSPAGTAELPTIRQAHATERRSSVKHLWPASPSTMAAACDGDDCDPPPAAKDWAGRELQPPGPLPEAQLPVALPLRTAGRAAPLNRSPASPQPSTPSTPRTQRRPTSRTRAGRNKHEDVGAAVARAGRPRRNKTRKLNSEASKPSRLSNTRHEPSDSACPTLLAFSCVPRGA
jgi:hypothetical protein